MTPPTQICVRRHRRPLLILALGVAVALVSTVPARASASELYRYCGVFYCEDEIHFAGDAEINVVTVTHADDWYYFTDGAGITLPPAPFLANLCERYGVGSTQARCKSDNLRDYPIRISLGAGNDVLTGSGPDQFDVSAGPGDDRIDAPGTVRGDAGNDNLGGYARGDQLSGGDGNDVLEGRGGRDALAGGAGFDFVSYAARPNPVTVTVSDGLANDGGVEDAVGDWITSGVEGIIGGNAGDTLIGNAAANVIDGRAGGDVIRGGDGSDALSGGSGPDQLHGDEGGYDRLFGDDGNDVLYGGPGDNDQMSPGAGTDLVGGGTGGTDIVRYDARTARVAVSLDDVANDGTDADRDGFGEELDNVLTSVEGAWGGGGDDLLVGSAASNSFFGGAGGDTLRGQESVDMLSGGLGADRIYGGAEDDVLHGGLGADTLSGNGGADALHARDSIRDTVDGGSGVDTADADPIDVLLNLP